MNIALWIIRALLALLFLASGIRKLTLPLLVLAKSAPALGELSVRFVRFIGAAELLGAIGLVLPSATRIAPQMTPAAAAGIALLMVCAAAFHVRRKEYANSGMTLLLLALAVFILYGRLALAPIAA